MIAMDLTRLSLSPTGPGAFGIATLGSNTLTAPYSMISPLTTIVSIIDTSVEREAAPTHGIDETWMHQLGKRLTAHTQALRTCFKSTNPKLDGMHLLKNIKVLGFREKLRTCIEYTRIYSI